MLLTSYNFSGSFHSKTFSDLVASVMNIYVFGANLLVQHIAKLHPFHEHRERELASVLISVIAGSSIIGQVGPLCVAVCVK